MKTDLWPYPTSDEVSHLACADVEVLRARIDQLIEERRELRARSVDHENVCLPHDLQLSRMEADMLTCLVRAKGMVSKYRLHESMYVGEPDTEPKIVDVLLCRLRKKLTAYGFPQAVVTHWGQGYSLDPTVKEAFRA